jgi:hypothetical protein
VVRAAITGKDLLTTGLWLTWLANFSDGIIRRWALEDGKKSSIKIGCRSLGWTFFDTAGCGLAELMLDKPLIALKRLAFWFILFILPTTFPRLFNCPLILNILNLLVACRKGHHNGALAKETDYGFY